MNNENVSIFVRYFHKMSQKSINQNNCKTSYRANSHRMKSKNESRDHFVEFERNQRFRYNVACQIDTRYKKTKYFKLNY